MTNQKNDPVIKELQWLFSGRLNQLCQEQQITLKQLSIKSKVSLSTLRRISQGKHGNIGINILFKLSHAFGITAAEFCNANLLPQEGTKDS